MKEQSKVKSSNPDKNISYKEATAELENILQEIESGETDVDLLSEKVKRALFLISVCRNKLRNTDEEVQKLISGFDREDDNDDDE